VDRNIKKKLNKSKNLTSKLVRPEPHNFGVSRDDFSVSHCPCGAPKEVLSSRSEPDDDLSVSRDDFSVSHCPCGTPKKVFTSRSEPDDDLSVSRDGFSVSRDDSSVSDETNSLPKEVFSSKIEINFVHVKFTNLAPG
jgi:hypothetical protein